jgi:hypothetical protein
MHNELEALGGVETPAFDFMGWIKKTFTPSYQDEINEYFKDCQDHADVERVMRNLMTRGIL